MNGRSLLIMFFCFTLVSCYYDKEEYLYPDDFANICDTTNTTYTKDIAHIIDQNCVSCHGTSSPKAGISLTSYNEVKSVAQSGKLKGVINGEPGYSKMPPSGLLDECKRNKINSWINQNMPQ